MYKLILGNTRVTIHDDKIRRSDATLCARQALNEAKSNGKQLSHIDIRQIDGTLTCEVTVRANSTTARKTLHQSIRDSLVATLTDSFFPASTFEDSRFWQDPDTGQEWSGQIVLVAKEDILKEVRTWLSETHNSSDH